MIPGKRHQVIAQFPVTELLRDVLGAVIGSATAGVEGKNPSKTCLLIPVIDPKHPAEMADIADERMKVKPTPLWAYLVSPEPKDRLSCSLFEIANEVAKQPVCPK